MRALVFVAAAAMCCGAAADILDDFNRADGTDMGPNWNEVGGDYWQILSGHGRCTGGNKAMDWVGTPNTAPYYKVVGKIDAFATPTGLSYVALRTGVGATDELFIKIQEQSPYTGFNYLGFYHRSGTGYAGWTGGSGFVALPQPIEQARMTTYFKDGDTDTIYVGLDTDFNGTDDFTMSSKGVNNIAGNLGNGVGIGGYGSATQMADFDNFNIVPEPTALAILALGTLLRRR